MPTLLVPQDYPTIALAVASAAVGDIILVDASYAGNENATITVNNLTVSAPASVRGIQLFLGTDVVGLTLSGTSDIFVAGNGVANTIIGNDADNVLRGGLGDDTINGGAGSDYADYRNASGAVQVSLAAGTSTGADGADTLISIENIRGSNFNDTLTGDAGDNFLRGMQGDDTLSGGEGTDLADYRNATGAVQVNLTTGTSSGADGVDTLISIENIRGSDFADTLTGDAGDNFLRGLLGDDTLDGSTGSDWADYRNATGAVQVNLATGTSAGAEGADTLISIENIRGSDFNDVLTGDGGDNFLRGMLGADTLDGGAGSDFADYRNASGAVQVNLATGTAMGADGADTLVNIESIRGSNFDDTLTGNAGVNLLRGALGNDTYVVDDSADEVIEFEGQGTDSVQSTASFALSFAVENLTLIGTAAINGTGNALNNVLTGNGADNVLNGGLGADQMTGGLGNDTYVVDEAGDVVTELAGEGTDTVQSSISFVLGDTLENLTLIGSDAINGTGNAANNTISGNSGNNVLTGGLGLDILTGGAGADIFDFNSAAESRKGALRDIVNFSRTEGDKIDLDTIDAAKGKGNKGDQDFHWVDKKDLDAKFTDEAGELRFDKGKLSGDINGDGRADFEIKINGALLRGDIDF
jgi:Ca2+-binding RTX toxin-like protein